MGTITRSFANNITTSGVLLPASLVNNSIANVTAYNASVATGNMVLISSQTASASASIDFTTGIDSTYKEYQFYFINIHPSVDNANLNMQFSTDGGSNYGVTTTTTLFGAFQREDGTGTLLGYRTALDVAQSTNFFTIAEGLDFDNDSNAGGSLSLFNPSSASYVKHFIANISCVSSSAPNYSINNFSAGYANTTTAINAVQFKMSSGNIDAGTILMYGIK